MSIFSSGLGDSVFHNLLDNDSNLDGDEDIDDSKDNDITGKRSKNDRNASSALSSWISAPAHQAQEQSSSAGENNNNQSKEEYKMETVKALFWQIYQHSPILSSK